MATIERVESGCFRAVYWPDPSGPKKNKTLDERNYDQALAKAQRIEAEARFWVDVNNGFFVTLAKMGKSPEFCHSVFTHKGHIPAAKFRALIRESGIDFKSEKSMRRSRKKEVRKFKWNGRRRTAEEILFALGSPISEPNFVKRIDRGWSIEKAASSN